MRVYTVKGAIAIGDSIGEFEGTVEALDVLLKPAVFSRDGVFIGEAEDLSEIEGHIFHGKLLLGKVVDGVAVRDEFKCSTGEFAKVGESPTQGNHTGFKGPGG